MHLFVARKRVAPVVMAKILQHVPFDFFVVHFPVLLLNRIENVSVIAAG